MFSVTARVLQGGRSLVLGAHFLTSCIKKNTLPLGTIWMDSQFSQFLLTLNQDQDVFENVGFIIIWV